MVLYCSREKGDRAVQCTVQCTVLWKMEMVAAPSLLVNSDESRQSVLVKFGKHFGFCFQQKIIGLIGFIDFI